MELEYAVVETCLATSPLAIAHLVQLGVPPIHSGAYLHHHIPGIGKLALGRCPTPFRRDIYIQHFGFGILGSESGARRGRR